MSRRVIDVGGLPTIAFGHRDPLWWAVILVVAIEATVTAFLANAYYYVRARTSPWPPVLADPRIAWLGVADLALLLVSVVPMHLAGVAAIEGRLRGMQRGMLAVFALGAVVLVVRLVVLDLLPFRWDANAYASIVWTLLGLHLLHVIAGLVENGMLLSILYLGPVEEKHRVDVEVTAPLWYFIVAGQALLVVVIHLDIYLGGAT